MRRILINSRSHSSLILRYKLYFKCLDSWKYPILEAHWRPASKPTPSFVWPGWSASRIPAWFSSGVAGLNCRLCVSLLLLYWSPCKNTVNASFLSRLHSAQVPFWGSWIRSISIFGCRSSRFFTSSCVPQVMELLEMFNRANKTAIRNTIDYI